MSKVTVGLFYYWKRWLKKSRYIGVVTDLQGWFRISCWNFTDKMWLRLYILNFCLINNFKQIFVYFNPSKFCLREILEWRREHLQLFYRELKNLVSVVAVREWWFNFVLSETKDAKENYLKLLRQRSDISFQTYNRTYGWVQYSETTDKAWTL